MRILVRGVMGAVCALAGCIVMGAALASAAVTHEYLPELSNKISEGVPASSGQQFTGLLVDPSALTVDSGHLWVDEYLNTGPSRVDKWNASTGAFLPPQLDEEGGVGSIGFDAIAVAHPGGEEQVYVGGGYEGKAAVAVYGSSGKLLPAGAWTGANTPAKEFAGEIKGVAVDDSASLETGGDLVVASGWGSGGDVVDIYKPQAGGAEPAAVIGELTGTPRGAFGSISSVAVSGFNSDILISEQDNVGKNIVDVFTPAPGMPGVYDFAFDIEGTPQASFEGINGLAVDSHNGDIYVAVGGSGESAQKSVDEFDKEGKYLGQIVAAPTGPSGEMVRFKTVEAVAIDPASSDVYIADYRVEGVKEPARIDVFGPNLVTPDVTTGAITAMTGTGDGHIKVTLNGTVNPLGEGEATCRFAWGETSEFGDFASCEPEKVAEATSPVSVHATITELPPDTTYRYRLQATNKNATNLGEASQNREFTTAGPGMHGESVSSVRAEAATFDAKIDPHGEPTTYYFEYGADSGYGTDTPLLSEAPHGALVGSGEGDLEVSRHVAGLSAATVYHYRVVVVSELALGEFETFYGPDQTFTTQTAGLPFQLPDGRAWEMVSPPQKHGAMLSWNFGEVNPLQASANGDALVDESSLPTEAEPASAVNPIELFGRGADGWTSMDIAPPHLGRADLGGGDFQYFSEDLKTAATHPKGSFPPLSPEASEATTYLRTNYLNGNAGELCTTGCYQPLVTPANVPAGVKFGGQDIECSPGTCHGPEFVGGTPDLRHVILSSAVDLTTTTTEGEGGLYEWSGGALALVNILPPGETNGKGGSVQSQAALGDAGTEGGNQSNAISSDGTRVIWTYGGGESGRLYSRNMATGSTTRIDVVQSGASGPANAEVKYEAASSDGSRIFFTDKGRLTPDSLVEGGRADLYEYNFNTGGTLTDLSVVPNEPAGVAGVLGTSEDGSYVYFADSGALASGATPHYCVTHECENLYVRHDGETKFIAQLSSQDRPAWQEAVNDRPARVSPNGLWLAFMSSSNLTGYDTTDALLSQRHDEEVYLYDATNGRLVCAGCNPTGARPVGAEYTHAEITGLRGFTQNSGVQIASSVPGWTTRYYQSRYLSNGGRLFFDSSDGLVPQDVNGAQDAYEYEPVGVGSCKASSATFSRRSEGCVGLISSGESSEESAFLDASETGSSVFFLTAAQLVPQDFDNALDIYDARECTASSPCISPGAVEPPPCETSDSCKAAPSPQPTIFGSPPSVTFSGAGNVTPSAAASVTHRALTQAQKLAKALKVCRKKKGKKRRVVCERRARSRYSAKKTGRANTTKKGRG